MHYKLRGVEFRVQLVSKEYIDIIYPVMELNGAPIYNTWLTYSELIQGNREYLPYVN